MSHKILPHFPRAESYIEPFFGGGGMFFAVPLGLYKIETVNDIYKQVVNFFQVLRNRTGDLVRVIEFTPWSWDEFKLALQETDDELEAARRFWIRAWQGYAAKHRTTEGQWVCDSATVIHTEIAESKLGKLHEFAARIRHVQFDNRDFADFLKLRVRSSSFVYCLHPDTNVRLSNEQFVRIADVQVGDVIAPGRRVLSKHTRHHVGQMLSLKIQGEPEGLRVTPEHKILAIRGRPSGTRQDTRTSERLWSERQELPAGELRVGDYVAIPLGGEEREVAWVWRSQSTRRGKLRPSKFSPSADLFRAIGYYAAEGFVQRTGARPTAVHWGFCVDELSTYIPDLARCCEGVFGLPVHWARWKETGTVRVWCYSTALAEFFSLYVPGLARTKSLHPLLMTAPLEDQLEILKGWMRGDGGMYKTSRNRCKLTGTSSSYTLARQMFTIALRLGMRPSMKQRGDVWDVYFASEDAARLGWEVSAKKFRSTRRVVSGHMLTRIREISSSDYDGEVWDLDVDGDDLFAAPFALVHNCDPPYVPEARAAGATNAYAHEMSVDDHRRLAERLHAADDVGAKVCLSGYDCDLYRELFPTWRKVAFEVPLLTKRRADAQVRNVTEVLWMNYPESEEIGETVASVPKLSQSKNRAEHLLALELRRRKIRG